MSIHNHVVSMLTSTSRDTPRYMGCFLRSSLLCPHCPLKSVLSLPQSKRSIHSSTIEMPGLQLPKSSSLRNAGHFSNIDLATASKMSHFSPKTTALTLPSFLRLIRDRLRRCLNAPPTPLEPYPWITLIAVTFRFRHLSNSALSTCRASSTVGDPSFKFTVTIDSSMKSFLPLGLYCSLTRCARTACREQRTGRTSES